ncbi:MAG: GtrA family protein [Clostridia bacterium]|nr:GtrA family protein [Clostridia bacterium]
MDKLKQLWGKYKEVLLYLIFGVATTAVNFVIYSLLVKLLHCNMTLSNTVAWLGAVIFAFVTNKLFVFESKRFDLAVLAKEILSFFGARILSGVIEIVLPEQLVNLGLDATIFGIDGLVAKALVSVIVIVLNYVFSKLFIFKKKKENDR